MKSNNTRPIVIFAFDVTLISISLFSLYFFYGEKIFHASFLGNANFIYLLIFFNIFSYYFFKIHKIVWSYLSVRDLKVIFLAGCLNYLLCIFLVLILNLNQDLYKLLLYQNLLLLILITLSRVIYKIINTVRRLKKGEDKLPLILIGAGDAAALLLQGASLDSKWNVVGLVDDDPRKRGRVISGKPILGALSELPTFCAQYRVNHAVLCIPSSTRMEGSRIVNIASKCDGLRILTVPSITDLLLQKTPIAALAPINFESLIDRDLVDLFLDGQDKFFEDKVVLITGAGGSIGSELCRQIAKYGPKQIVLFDISEYAIYTIGQFFLDNLPEIPIALIVGDVRNAVRLNNVFVKYKPNLVFHAAAYKHVPLMESENIAEALNNNVIGTINIAEISAKYQVEKFVMVSTDKAVNPTNVMGATKRLAELACLNLSKDFHTKFIIVRFGNVLGSNGSVVPKFQEQIHRGGPITITHPDIERFFMTIPEACELVLQASIIGNGSEVFILDMGKPIRIVDLAKRMIELSGIEKDRIQIQFTGLRPGEKLYEELMLEYEVALQTSHEKLRVSKSGLGNFTMTVEEIKQWVHLYEDRSDEEIKKALKEILSEYTFN